MNDDRDARAQLPLDVRLRPHPTLAGFLPGPDAEALDAVSRLAHAKAGGVLYLWGAPGTGKSHLLEAASREASMPAVYAPLGGRGAESPAALPGLSGHALICIDGLERAAGSPEWSRALFALHLAVEAADTRMLLACREPPRRAGLALDDLTSRLSRALVIRLRGLDDAGRREFLKREAHARGFALTDEVADFLLHRVRRDLHSLVAVLERIDAGSLAEKRRVTVPFVRRYLDREE